jgi:catechol 2,3-dioxygenase-like lactoylglutathione lyase family enzyme
MEERSISSTHLYSVVPQFTVPDVVRTAEYYRDTLGFEVVSYWDGEKSHLDPTLPAVFGIVERDNIRMHFNRADPSSEVRSGRAEGAFDVYFHVAGVNALAEDVRQRGATILDGPEDRGYGQREVVVLDCNELVLAFGEEIT